MIVKIAIAVAVIISWLLTTCCMIMIVASDEDDRLEEKYWQLIEKELEKCKEDKNDRT